MKGKKQTPRTEYRRAKDAVVYVRERYEAELAKYGWAAFHTTSCQIYREILSECMDGPEYMSLGLRLYKEYHDK